MKRLLLENPLVRRMKHSPRGQSVVLMALAFIALIAFVGLVTDVALLFVRYSALRRAVDSAAIAAAGQIREGTDYGEVTVAAEQFIQLHGMQPDSVLVETCETDIYRWRAGLGPWEGNPHPESADPVGSTLNQLMGDTELCNWDDPHKLVRVSAQVKSETTFLSLVGVEDITLEATSVSETALLDIALVIDTSESMSQDTQRVDLESIGLTYPYDGGGARAVRQNCEYEPSGTNGNERWAGCCNDPGTGFVGDGGMQDNGYVVPNGLIWHDVTGNGMYDPYSGEEGVASSANMSSDGYVTSTGIDQDSFNFTTLICNPFKDVRDAARAFIKRLDFVRGDRVVLVTFDRLGVAYKPTDADGDEMPAMMRSERIAITTLNTKVGVMMNTALKFNSCKRHVEVSGLWQQWLADGGDPATQPAARPFAYESLAACGNTNVGGGILAANNALTDPTTVRREAVWVMIVLSDGAANVTDPVGEVVDDISYGSWGYCPWWTFCKLSDPDYTWPECTLNNPSQVELDLPLCNDNDPDTRYFCIDWEDGQNDPSNPECGVTGRYDADDYARDMADLAGLIEVDDGIPGNFVAMFAIAFGAEAADEPTAAPLLRYIADAGDNGFIDNNLQQDLREDRDTVPTYPDPDGAGPLKPDYPESYGGEDPCYDFADEPREWCGQYYYADPDDPDKDLNVVFEQIASRMFTRLSR